MNPIRFRPSLQPLEGRRLMAADLGIDGATLQNARQDETIAIGTGPARTLTISNTSISGNTIGAAGGSVDDHFSELGDDSQQKVRDGEIRVESWSWGETNVGF